MSFTTAPPLRCLRGAPRLLFYLMAIHRLWRPLSRPQADSVSLRLGHGAALTCHRHVIHYRAAASLPKRGAKTSLLPNGNTPTLETPQSAAGRQRLAAARSRRGSDMPPACHSLPRRRFATLKGAPLRCLKGAALRGEVLKQVPIIPWHRARRDGTEAVRYRRILSVGAPTTQRLLLRRGRMEVLQ